MKSSHRIHGGLGLSIHYRAHERNVELSQVHPVHGSQVIYLSREEMRELAEYIDASVDHPCVPTRCIR